MTFLNHGSYGAAPFEVLAVQDEWRRRLERQPCQFVNRVLPDAIRAAAAELAAFLGARPEDLALVENTTTGINAILRSLPFQAGDEVVVTDHVYNAVRNTLRFVLEPVGARLVVVPVGLPVTSDDELLGPIVASLTERTRLVLIDHVASITAVRFPVASIAEVCRERGIPVLVDGAHAPGMLDLDVPALGVDWYVGNVHKWLCAPKGAAFLWARDDRQKGLHPTVISHDLGKGFTAEFDKIGTRDASSWLSVPAALTFHARLGGPTLRARNHDVAVAGGHRLAERFGTETGAPDELFGSMATVRLPGDLAPDRPTAEALKAWLWDTHRIEAHVMPFASALWLRLSIQAYNDARDVERLCDALAHRLLA